MKIGNFPPEHNLVRYGGFLLLVTSAKVIACVLTMNQ